ncbi:hypothetical protein AAEH76_17775 [Shewanella algae]
MTNLEKSQLILFVYTVSNAMLISTSKIVGKTVVVRVRRCVVGDLFFVLKSLMWGLLALVKACKAWTILLLPTALVSVTDPVTATG